MSTPRTGETELHKRLKWSAAAVLLVRGLPMVGLEVRVPGLRRRADVAGLGDLSVTARRYNAKERATKDAYIGAAPTVMVAEIKASRADLLRDIGDHAELLEKLNGLHLRRLELEENIRRDEPNLRHRASLLAEEDSWRYDQSANAAYHKLLKEITRVRASVYGKTKFDLLARSGVADEYMLVTVPGICKPEEIPEHWGWMSIDCDSAAARLRMNEIERRGAVAEGDLPELGWGPGWELSYKHPAVQARWMQRGKMHDAVAVFGGGAAGAGSRNRRKAAAVPDQPSLFVEPGAAVADTAEAVGRGVVSPVGAGKGGRNLGTGGGTGQPAAPVGLWIYPGIGSITLHVAPKRFSCSSSNRKKWERSLAQAGSALLRQLLSGRLQGNGATGAGLPGAIPFQVEE